MQTSLRDDCIALFRDGSTITSLIQYEGAQCSYYSNFGCMDVGQNWLADSTKGDFYMGLDDPRMRDGMQAFKCRKGGPPDHDHGPRGFERRSDTAAPLDARSVRLEARGNDMAGTISHCRKVNGKEQCTWQVSLRDECNGFYRDGNTITSLVQYDGAICSYHSNNGCRDVGQTWIMNSSKGNLYPSLEGAIRDGMQSFKCHKSGPPDHDHGPGFGRRSKSLQPPSNTQISARDDEPKRDYRGHLMFCQNSLGCATTEAFNACRTFPGPY